MKLLVVGIDGLDKVIVNAMPMPYLQKLLQTSTNFPAEIDLFSRGWPEMICGLPGVETGAFYNKPMPGRPVTFSLSFNTRSYADNPNVIPLWELLNRRGYKVGFLNVPTTMPAPKVDGFFVSGGGGGFQKNDNEAVPPEACYPREIGAMLTELDYIHDVRLVESGIHDIDHFFDQLEAMQHTHTEGFVSLQRHQAVDMGFIAYLSARDANYLAYADIEALIANNGQAANRIQQRILDLYRQFDTLLQSLVMRLAPQNIMVVSDHGMSAYRYNVNVNAFLQSNDWHISIKPAVSGLKNVVNNVKHLFPSQFRKQLLKTIPQARTLTGKNETDFQKSTAFGGLFIPGIYLNDERYYGIVKTSDKERLIEQIIASFNSSPEAKNIGMQARHYRSLHPHAHAAHYLPDIWIDKPDTVQFKYVGAFLANNPTYGCIDSLKGLSFDNVAGTKGRHPLIYLHGVTELPEASNMIHPDLTVVYRLIERIMN